MEKEYFEIAEIFKALGDENRIKILELLKEGEKCGNDILADMSITQPTLSHHLSVLCSATLVEQRREGKKIYFAIADEIKDDLKEIVEELLKKQKNKKREDDIVIL